MTTKHLPRNAYIYIYHIFVWIYIHTTVTHSYVVHKLALYFRTYRRASNKIRTLIGNRIVDHSDVLGAAPVGAAPTTSSFSTLPNSLKSGAKTARRDEKHLSCGLWRALYQRFDGRSKHVPGPGNDVLWHSSGTECDLYRIAYSSTPESCLPVAANTAQ